MAKKQEVKLTDEQITRLNEILSTPAGTPIMPIEEKEPLVGRIFQWVDDNIISKTTRLWMYFLEIFGCVCIAIIISDFQYSFRMIRDASTAFDLQKAQVLMQAIKDSSGPLAAMIATISAALPALMAAFRTLGKKWGTSGDSSGNGSNPQITPGP